MQYTIPCDSLKWSTFSGVTVGKSNFRLTIITCRSVLLQFLIPQIQMQNKIFEYFHLKARLRCTWPRSCLTLWCKFQITSLSFFSPMSRQRHYAEYILLYKIYDRVSGNQFSSYGIFRSRSFDLDIGLQNNSRYK